MISQDDLNGLKALRQLAKAGPIHVAHMNSSKTMFQLQAARANGSVIVGSAFTEMNAHYMAAAWEWLPKLIEEIESLTREADRAADQVTGNRIPAGPLPQRTAESGAPVARERHNRFTRRRGTGRIAVTE